MIPRGWASLLHTRNVPDAVGAIRVCDVCDRFYQGKGHRCRRCELREAPLTLMDIPIRLDSTLAAPDEVWLEGLRGDAVRVCPSDER